MGADILEGALEMSQKLTWIMIPVLHTKHGPKKMNTKISNFTFRMVLWKRYNLTDLHSNILNWISMLYRACDNVNWTKPPLVSGSMRICCLAPVVAAPGFNQLCVQSETQKIVRLEVYKDDLHSKLNPKKLPWKKQKLKSIFNHLNNKALRGPLGQRTLVYVGLVYTSA